MVFNIINFLNSYEKNIVIIIYFSYILVYFFFGIRILTHYITFIYPCLKSLKSIFSKDDFNDKLWLNYWIIISFLNFLDILSNSIPIYYIIKIIFSVWLYHKNTKGIKKIHKLILLNNTNNTNNTNNLPSYAFKKK